MRSRNHRHHLLSVLQCCIPYMLLSMLDIEDRLCKIVDDYVKYYYPPNSFKWLSPLCQEPSALHVIASINYAARYRILTVDSEDSNWGEICLCVCVVADLIDCHHEWVSSVNTSGDTSNRRQITFRSWWSPHQQQWVHGRSCFRLHSGLDGPLTNRQQVHRRSCFSPMPLPVG